MATRVKKKNIATVGSGHVAPGPPASSMIPPVPPPTGAPAPFLYIAESKTATETSTRLKVKGDRCLVKGSIMTIEMPGNQPAGALPIKDIVTHAHMKDAKMTDATGKKRLVTKNKPVCATFDPTVLNILTDQMEFAQSTGKLLSALGFARSCANPKKHGAKIITAAEPVAVVDGAVVDEMIDVTLSGTIDVVLARSYASRENKTPSPFGRGFRHSLLQYVVAREGEARFLDEDGVVVVFALGNGPSFHRGRRLTLTPRRDGSFEISGTTTKLVRDYAPLTPGGPAWLRCIRDRFGNEVRLEYAGGLLSRVIDTARRELRFTYDHRGHIVKLEVRVDEAVCLARTYEYDDDGDLVRATDPCGFSQSYAYDAKHRMIRKTLENGVRFHYRYQADSDRCVKAWGDGGLHAFEFIYDPDRRITVAHGNPVPHEYVWSEKGAVLRNAAASGDWLDERKYDDDLYLLEVTDAAGNKHAYEHDARGNLVKQIDPAGNVTVYHYLDDLCVQKTGPDGAVTTYEWNERRALTSITGPDGGSLSLFYDGYGRVVEVVGSHGRGTIYRYEWNDRHDLVRQLDSSGATMDNRCDALGYMIERVECGVVFRFERNARGDMTAVHLPTGEWARFEYDGLGLPTRATNHLGRTGTMRWSGTGVLAEMITADGGKWEFTYDSNERLKTVKNPKCEVHEYRYDRAGRIEEELTFDGRVIRMSYSKSNRLARIDYSDETFRAFTYDVLGNLVMETTSHQTITIERDVRGSVRKSTVVEHSGETVIEYERDAFGQVVAETQNGARISWEIDARARVVARTLPGDVVTRYDYEPSGLLAAVDHAGYRLSIRRDAYGREIERLLPSGVHVHRAYDPTFHRWADQWITAPSSPRETEPTIIARRRWDWGLDGLPSALIDLRWGPTQFLHDEVGRLVQASGARLQESMDYDPGGSVRIRRGGAPDAAWAIRMGNVLLRTPDVEYENDERHRRVKKRRSKGGAATEYVWDCRDQLREVRLPDGTHVLFTYDALGRRVRKEVAPPPPPASELRTESTPTRVVRYLWDGDELAAEIDSELGQRVFVFDRGTLWPMLQQEQGETFAIVTDFRGAPRELVDSRGRLSWAGTYSAWGAIADAWIDPTAMMLRARPVEPPFRVVGQYWDEESELAYNRFRYFDPETARFLSPDPLGFAGGNNLFAYDANPTVGVDPFGLAECKPWGYIKFITKPPNTYGGKPVGMQATLTPEMRGTGSEPGKATPPGWDKLPGGNDRARAHLLGNQLGGPGMPENIVAMHADANSRAMLGNENAVAAAVDSGKGPVSYNVMTSGGQPPASVTMTATQNGASVPMPNGNVVPNQP